MQGPAGWGGWGKRQCLYRFGAPVGCCLCAPVVLGGVCGVEGCDFGGANLVGGTAQLFCTVALDGIGLNEMSEADLARIGLGAVRQMQGPAGWGGWGIKMQCRFSSRVW